MTGELLLRDLGVILVGAAAGALLARPLRLPAVAAFIVAGVILGPLTGLVAVTEELSVMAESGVALLLFLVGLEMSVERARDVGGVAVVAAVVQMLATFAGGLGLALLLGFELAAATVVALAVTFSSTAVVVKLLSQKRELRERHGKIAVGVLLVQDVAVVVALTLVGSLGGGEIDGLGQAAAEVGTPLLALGGLLLVTVVATRTLLPALFRRAQGRETLFVWSLSWCFLFILASELVHLPVEIGAFLAGIGLAQLPQAHDLSRRVAPLTNFFLAVFFVALGIQLDPSAAAGRIGTVAALVVFVMMGKTAVFLWILARRRQDERTAFLTALSLAQVSEFSFILAALAVDAGLLDRTAFSVIGGTGLLTIALSSFLILRDRDLYETVSRRGLLRPFGPFGAPPTAPPEGTGEAEPRREGHVVVVGMNALGRRLARTLAEQGERVVAVDRDPEKLGDLPVETLLGDVEQPGLLEDANLEGARLLVSALQIEETNKLLAYRCRRAGVPCSIHAFNPSVEEELTALDVDHLMAPKERGAHRIVERLRELDVLRGT